MFNCCALVIVCFLYARYEILFKTAFHIINLHTEVHHREHDVIIEYNCRNVTKVMINDWHAAQTPASMQIKFKKKVFLEYIKLKGGFRMLNIITHSWSCEKFLTSTIFIQCHNDSLSMDNDLWCSSILLSKLLYDFF